MKNLAVLYTNESPLIEAIKARIDWCTTDCFTSCNFDADKYDLIVSAGYRDIIPFNALKSHLSLLPAFNSPTPVHDAILSGVKVTGITIYYTSTQKIVAQYPLFIYNDAHFDEVETELRYIEQTLFPLVIDKVLKNEPFETQEIMNNGRCGNCKNCNTK